MDCKELHEAVCRDIQARTAWEDRQALLYKARYRGLRRKNLPFPGASDINWPLVDGIIDKLKPVYFGQLFATELLATFLPTASASGNAATLATSAAQWFDYLLKQESDLEASILHVIDFMLMLGRPALKITWDATAERLVFTPIQPAHLIVPESTTKLTEADRIVHVQRYSVEAYKRVPGFNQSPEFLKRIKGSGQSDGQTGSSSAVRQEHERRKGITEANNPEEIVVWEVWEQVGAGKWEFETISPVFPEEPVKTRIKHPYEHGLPPFVDFCYEVTQPDWLAPRGVCEIVLPFQAQLTKLLNEKNDAMTFSSAPVYTSDRDVPNTANLRMRPGQILPHGVKPAAMPTPPVDFERQMLLMRDIGERLAAVPDYGMAQVQNPKSARTATEIEQLASVSSQSADLRMRIFRRSLGAVYQQAWGLLKQYAKNRLTIWFDESVKEIPKEALGGSYRIAPSGSADGVTRQQAWRKAVARMQMFAGDPFVNQAELRKSVLEADEAGLVKRLFTDPGQTQAEQAEAQMTEVCVIRLGYPAAVTGQDDHATHIKTVIRYIQGQAQAGQPPTPQEVQLLAQHVAEHVQALKETDPKMAKMAADAFAVIGEQIAAMAQQQAQAAPAQGGLLAAVQ